MLFLLGAELVSVLGKAADPCLVYTGDEVGTGFRIALPGPPH